MPLRMELHTPASPHLHLNLRLHELSLEQLHITATYYQILYYYNVLHLPTAGLLRNTLIE